MLLLSLRWWPSFLQGLSTAAAAAASDFDFDSVAEKGVVVVVVVVMVVICSIYFLVPFRLFVRSKTTRNEWFRGVSMSLLTEGHCGARSASTKDALLSTRSKRLVDRRTANFTHTHTQTN